MVDRLGRGSSPVANTGTAVRRRDAEATKGRLLTAAAHMFAARGMEARIEDITEEAGTTRAMAYYYFGSKEGLYLAALEATFLDLVRKEQAIDVDDLDPLQAISQIVQAKFDHYQRHPLYLKLLSVENLNEARFLRNSARLPELHDPLFATFARVLAEGRRAGVFKRDADPAQLYVSIIGLGYFAFSNRHTLAHILGVETTSEPSVMKRRRLVVDMVAAYLTS